MLACSPLRQIVYTAPKLVVLLTPAADPVGTAALGADHSPNQRELLSIMTCIIGVSTMAYAAIFLARDLFCLVPMLFLFAIDGIVDPLVIGYLHHHTESHIRATVESFSSLGLRVVSVGVGLLFGYISSEYSIFAGFLMLSGLCFGYLLIFRIAGKRHFHKNGR